MESLETLLRERIRSDEAAASRDGRDHDSLWDHVTRVADIACQLGEAEGVDRELCRLAGLFHDAGKFGAGRYHGDDLPEESRSVRVLRDLSARCGVPDEHVDAVAEAIEQLYRDDPEPTPLAQVLFDADNLDKLGPLGVANYFLKAGLRGRGIGEGVLARITVELTYARHAPQSLLSRAGRELAQRRAPYTVRFFHDLLEQLREDGLADLRIEQVEYRGITLDLVTPAACSCGGSPRRDIWEVPGMKCTEIHVRHTCPQCARDRELRFCRPRLSRAV